MTENEILNKKEINTKKAEALESLFSFVMPKGRAKEAAKALLSRFYGVSGIFDAEPSEIKEVFDFDEKAIAVIKLIPTLLEEYINEKTNIEGEHYDNIEKLGRYLVGRYLLEERELVLLLLFDNSFRLICEKTVCIGSVNSARLSIKELCETAKCQGASCAVLSHNHPKGIAIPSAEDIATTSAAVSLFEAAGIPLIEHILVAGKDYTPIIYTKLGKKRKTVWGEV